MRRAKELLEKEELNRQTKTSAKKYQNNQELPPTRPFTETCATRSSKSNSSSATKSTR